MKAKRLSVAIALAAASLAAQAQSTPEYTLTDLGAIGTSNYSLAYGLSSNGAYAMGREYGTSFADFTWSASTGRVDWTMPTGHAYASIYGGVNDSGVAVATASTTTHGGGNLPIMNVGGTTTTLNLPTGYATSGIVDGINNNGIAVGSATGTSTEAVLYNTNTNTATGITATAADGSYMTQALAINDSGLVVGTGLNTVGTAVALVYNSVTGTMTELAAGSGVSAAGVSENGWVAGTSASGTPYLWSAATGMVSVALPGTLTSGSAVGVNSSGLVVGKSGAQIFLSSGSSSYTLDSIVTGDAGWTFNSTSGTVGGIDENGDILVSALDNGVIHAALLTPVPEPTTWALMLGGLAAIGSIARRRGRKA